MTDIYDDLFDEADALSSVDTSEAKNLSTLVRELRDVDRSIEDHESLLKTLKDQRQKLTMERIPLLMDEMGMSRVDVDGVIVTRKMIVSASISEKNKEAAFGWLRRCRRQSRWSRAPSRWPTGTARARASSKPASD
jgi:hypothetical protein